MGKKSKLDHNPSSMSTRDLVEMETKDDKDARVLPSEFKEHKQNYRSKEHVTFSTLLIIAEIVVVILYAVWFDYAYEEAATPTEVQRFYNYFRDINIMIFFGFGFLMTFLRKYGYSAVGYTFLISALVVQWSILLQGFFETIEHKDYKFTTYGVGIEQMVNGLFCAGAVMISFGGVIGKVSPSQLLVMGIVEPMFYWLNIYIIILKLEALDIGGGMTIHTFGAYFGLTVTWFVTNHTTKDHSGNAPSYTSDIFSFAGTIFLWIMWPSFNAAIARPGHAELRALANTFLSITASVLSAFLVSRLVTPGHKLDAVHIQNSTLAGGVAMGVAADLNITPAGAIACGFTVGAISVLGYRYLTPFLSKRLGIQDICGIHNLHGMPGICSGLIGVFATLGASYHKGPYEEDGGYEEWMPHKDAQAGYQMAALLISLALGIAGGMIVGVFMMLTWNNKWFMVGKEKEEEKYFDDAAFWHLPHAHTEEADDVMDLPA